MLDDAQNRSDLNRPVPTVAPTVSRADDPRPAVVVAQHLSKVFKDFWMRRKVAAVSQLDFEIKQGEVFGLIGPNGSGKSTTIKMILGLLHKTGGRLAVLGKTPENVSVKKRIGYLPEESYLYPFLNAWETLDFYGKLFGLERKARRQRTAELLEMVGLDAVQFRPIGEYSKGMQRRIGIAQALINDPDFLILDEPTSGLDPIGIRQIKDLILHLGRRGKTILLSSHLLADVEDVCDYMVVLYGGRKQREGTSDSLLTTYDRTIIETEALDPNAVEAVRKFISEHEGKRVLSIAPARQSLESLFLDIVEKAQQQRLETFGAKSGGQTADFLRNVDDAATASEGAELLDKLVQLDQPKSADSRTDPNAGSEQSAASAVLTAGTAGVNESVLQSLRVDSKTSAATETTETDQTTTGPSATTTAESSAAEEKSTSAILGANRKSAVDNSVLDSLVDAYGESTPTAETATPEEEPEEEPPANAP